MRYPIVFGSLKSYGSGQWADALFVPEEVFFSQQPAEQDSPLPPSGEDIVPLEASFSNRIAQVSQIRENPHHGDPGLSSELDLGGKSDSFGYF